MCYLHSLCWSWGAAPLETVNRIRPSRNSNENYKFIFRSTSSSALPCSRSLMFLSVISFLMSVLQVKCNCLTGKCEKISFDVHQDADRDEELEGHVFHNSVTSNTAQCYLWCTNDCRCLSINYKIKNETKYCELNEGSHFTDKNSLTNTSGSTYYKLRRKYLPKVIILMIL